MLCQNRFNKKHSELRHEVRYMHYLAHHLRISASDIRFAGNVHYTK